MDMVQRKAIKDLSRAFLIRKKDTIIIQSICKCLTPLSRGNSLCLPPLHHPIDHQRLTRYPTYLSRRDLPGGLLTKNRVKADRPTLVLLRNNPTPNDLKRVALPASFRCILSWKWASPNCWKAKGPNRKERGEREIPRPESGHCSRQGKRSLDASSLLRDETPLHSLAPPAQQQQRHLFSPSHPRNYLPAPALRKHLRPVPAHFHPQMTLLPSG